MGGVVALARSPRPGSDPRAARPLAGVAPRLVGPACIVASCVSLQTGAAIATTAFVTFGPAGTGALRFLAAAAILTAVVRPRLRGRPARFWRAVGALGAAAAATNLLLYEAIARVPLGVAGTLVFLGPLALVLLARRSGLDVVWAAAAGLGVALLAGASSDVPLAGVALALGAGGSVAASIVVARGLASQSQGLDGLTLSIVAAALITLPIGSTALADHASALSPGAIAVVVGRRSARRRDPLRARVRRAPARRRPDLRDPAEPRSGRRGDRGPGPPRAAARAARAARDRAGHDRERRRGRDLRRLTRHRRARHCSLRIAQRSWSRHRPPTFR